MHSENISRWLETIGFVALPDSLQIVIAILASFISEDATLLALALLAQAQLIKPWVFWVGGFAGIIIGDVLLYIAGRLMVKGRTRLLWFDLTKLKTQTASHEKGIFVGLMLAQFFPGSRFPAYLSAGISQYPFGLFVLSKAIVLPLWLYLFLLLGDVLLLFLQEHTGFALLVLVLIVYGYLKVTCFLNQLNALPLTSRLKALRYHLLRYRYFEFWPAPLFYWPVFFYILFFTVKFRNGALPAASNPMIEHGGWVGETKSAICDLLTASHFSKLKHAVITTDCENKPLTLQQHLATLSLNYPIILKPEKGLRGDGVCLAHTQADAEAYLAQAHYAVLLQEYCDYAYEAGIFYVRYPHQTQSTLFSITDKHFPTVVGDGQQTLYDLILQDPRARYIASVYFARFADDLSRILANGERLRLVESGNHAQGVAFTDGMQTLYTPALHAAMDALAAQLPEFYIGRFDIRYKSVDAFRAGKDFKVIEVNGAGAEATHIYDRKVSLGSAYKVLFKQYAMLYEIGAWNVANGTDKPSAIALLKTWRAYLQLAKQYRAAS